MGGGLSFAGGLEGTAKRERKSAGRSAEATRFVARRFTKHQRLSLWGGEGENQTRNRPFRQNQEKEEEGADTFYTCCANRMGTRELLAKKERLLTFGGKKTKSSGR